MTDKTTLQTNEVVEIRRIVNAPDSVVTKEQSVIKKVGCDKIVLKTSYRGAQGPRGEAAVIDDFEIESLLERFQSRLV